MNIKKNISILGSTGSIGRNTLEVIKEYKKIFNVKAISTNSSIELLKEQIDLFNPEYIVISDENAYKKFKGNIPKNIKLLYGDDGLLEISTLKDVDIVVNALVGFKGFLPTLNALKNGKVCAIANKETIVVGGEIIMKSASDKDRQIIPIDSEHSAIHSLLRNRDKKSVSRLILTSSGGPFRTLPKEKLKEVTLKQALNHPTWSMGNKITIDSSTMMNKGFEVIEAHHLFGFDFSQIDVIIHKESIIHSMIETIDGEIYAQLGVADMKFPIQNALTYPDILPNSFGKLKLYEISSLTFEKPDMDKFPLLRLAYDAGRIGNSMPVVLNASNEIAVNSFLMEKISYIDIYKYVSETIEKHNIINNPTYEEIIEIDKWARKYTINNIEKN